MSAQPASTHPSESWTPAPGEPAVLRLDADGPGVSVRLGARTVAPARETALARVLRMPGVWGGVVACLAVLVLASSALATGAVRPAPPLAATPRPGEPTPTPDTRPALSFGGFVLQSPVQATPVPPAASSSAPGDAQVPSLAPLTVDAAEQPQEADSVVVEATPPPCTNLFGIGCGARPAPARPLAPRQQPQAVRTPDGDRSVLPVPSPAARPDPSRDELEAASFGPPRGSTLEAALHAASRADDNFAREVDPNGRASTQSGPRPAQQDSERAAQQDGARVTDDGRRAAQQDGARVTDDGGRAESSGAGDGK